jgi:hypothetical protein
VDLNLRRLEKLPAGIFSELTGGSLHVAALEHAYESEPKLPDGVYICRRGVHHLPGHPDLETFEITGVEGHTGILFHRGNWQTDSDGCLLLGLRREGLMVVGSHLAFTEFMKLQKGVDEFKLTVQS